jgi:hypothetical protein
MILFALVVVVYDQLAERHKRREHVRHHSASHSVRLPNSSRS